MKLVVDSQAISFDNEAGLASAWVRRFKIGVARDRVRALKGPINI